MLTLKTAWADGTRQLLFEPLELFEKLAALISRPRINLVLHHGVLAPHDQGASALAHHERGRRAGRIPQAPRRTWKRVLVPAVRRRTVTRDDGTRLVASTPRSRDSGAGQEDHHVQAT